VPQSPDRSQPARCLCATVRRASRLLNRRYEEALRPSGISTSQYELLMTLRSAGASGQNKLAQLVETDQTTLSRNLTLLLNQRWIEVIADKQDARRRTYRTTRLGLEVLAEANRRWRQAHDEMERLIGAPMSDLWPLLDRILRAAREPA
jgi:DNA-binding MarR family transcriptional regulator